jgi:hypothetical protein
VLDRLIETLRRLVGASEGTFEGDRRSGEPTGDDDLRQRFARIEDAVDAPGSEHDRP